MILNINKLNIQRQVNTAKNTRQLFFIWNLRAVLTINSIEIAVPIKKEI
jgi:hypothetical protein